MMKQLDDGIEEQVKRKKWDAIRSCVDKTKEKYAYCQRWVQFFKRKNIYGRSGRAKCHLIMIIIAYLLPTIRYL